MMTDSSMHEMLVHLHDLENRSRNRNMHLESGFLNEEEQAAARKEFPESAFIKYDGGYNGAMKKKVIFLTDEEDDLSDIVCISAETDQRFRKIGHRDILGTLMHLGIDRHSFGDFWIDDKSRRIYLYTSSQMAGFLEDNFLRIANLNVSFQQIEEHPVQVHQMKEIICVIASERADAIVASLAHTSRSEAKNMIRQGMVQIDHVVLEKPDEVCNNNCTISIRGTGRFLFQGVKNRTKKDRIVAEFQQFV